jgi:hypothetical protein
MLSDLYLGVSNQEKAALAAAALGRERRDYGAVFAARARAELGGSLDDLLESLDDGSTWDVAGKESLSHDVDRELASLLITLDDAPAGDEGAFMASCSIFERGFEKAPSSLDFLLPMIDDGAVEEDDRGAEVGGGEEGVAGEEEGVAGVQATETAMKLMLKWPLGTSPATSRCLERSGGG